MSHVLYRLPNFYSTVFTAAWPSVAVASELNTKNSDDKDTACTSRVLRFRKGMLILQSRAVQLSFNRSCINIADLPRAGVRSNAIKRGTALRRGDETLQEFYLGMSFAQQTLCSFPLGHHYAHCTLSYVCSLNQSFAPVHWPTSTNTFRNEWLTDVQSNIDRCLLLDLRLGVRLDCGLGRLEDLAKGLFPQLLPI